MRHEARLLGLGLLAAVVGVRAVAADGGRDAHVSLTAPAWTAGAGDSDAIDVLRARRLGIPVVGVTSKMLRDTFGEQRGAKPHEALDIAAPRGTRVVAVDTGRVAKLFNSIAGGLTIYQFDRDERFAYYYAHLDAYAEGLREGATVKRGDLLGYVGSTGNAAAEAPHLHFTIYRLPAGKQWWRGVAINPFPLLTDP